MKWNKISLNQLFMHTFSLVIYYGLQRGRMKLVHSYHKWIVFTVLITGWKYIGDTIRTPPFSHANNTNLLQRSFPDARHNIEDALSMVFSHFKHTYPDYCSFTWILFRSYIDIILEDVLKLPLLRMLTMSCTQALLLVYLLYTQFTCRCGWDM